MDVHMRRPSLIKIFIASFDNDVLLRKVRVAVLRADENAIAIPQFSVLSMRHRRMRASGAAESVRN
jgi:hypothetical protein